LTKIDRTILQKILGEIDTSINKQYDIGREGGAIMSSLFKLTGTCRQPGGHADCRQAGGHAQVSRRRPVSPKIWFIIQLTHNDTEARTPKQIFMDEKIL
jgi:hypothetical protein